MIAATQLRPGMVIKFNNDLYSVFSVNHRTPGNLRGFVQAKMRSLRSGTMTEHRFSSEDKVEKAILEEHEMEYLYDDGEYFYFMNTENYEQMHLTKELLGDATEYLIPQLKVTVEFYEGKPLGVELPATVDLTVVETEPGLKGSTVSNVTKPAKMETGLVVQVPPFIIRRRKDPRQYFRRHVSGKSLNDRIFFLREDGSQIEHDAVAFDPRNNRRVVCAQVFFERVRVLIFDHDQPCGERQVRRRAASDHRFSGFN